MISYLFWKFNNKNKKLCGNAYLWDNPVNKMLTNKRYFILFEFDGPLNVLL